MEKYYIFGVVAAIAVFAFILLLFGVGKIGNQTTSVPQQAYGIANSSLDSSVYNDILGLQTYQNMIPNGKQLFYNANYSLSTSTTNMVFPGSMPVLIVNPSAMLGSKACE